MILTHFDHEPDHLQVIFIVDPIFSDNEIYSKIIEGKYWFDDLVFPKSVKNIITEKCSNISKDRIWILKEKGFNSIVTIMLRLY